MKTRAYAALSATTPLKYRFVIDMATLAT